MIVGSTAAAEDWVAGEKWVYQHEGPMPWRPPDQVIAGDRVRQVISIEGEAKDKRWLIQDKWGDNDDRPGTVYVNQDRLFDKINVGDNMIRVEPGFPFDYMNMKAGEEKTFEPRFVMSEDQSWPMKVTAKRVNDETVKVPAGEFENCTHVKIVEKMSFEREGEKTEITVEREHWYHPKANGLVKETFIVSMGDQPRQKATSALKSHSKGE
jgi:hypothetical protein